MAAEPILIVDDSPVNLKLARVVLVAAGFSVHTAASGEEALAVLESLRPQLILTDIQMPGIDGYQLASRLKADPKTSGIRVVALSAFAMKGDAERALAAGCDGYIPKPIDVHTFPQLVAGYLG